MQSIRLSPLLQILIQNFTPPKKQLWIDSSQAAFKSIDTTDKVFDKFPALCEEKDREIYAAQFNVLLALISKDLEVGAKGETCSRAVSAKIKEFILTIIKLGCAEILDAEGRVNLDLSTYLRWSQNLTQTQVVYVIKSFFHRVFQDFIVNNNRLEAYFDAYNMLTAIVRRNTNHIIASYLIESGKFFNKTELSAFINTLVKKPISVSGVAVPLGVALAAATTGLVLFHVATSKSKDSNDPIKTFTPTM